MLSLCPILISRESDLIGLNWSWVRLGHHLLKFPRRTRNVQFVLGTTALNTFPSWTCVFSLMEANPRVTSKQVKQPKTS